MLSDELTAVPGAVAGPMAALGELTVEILPDQIVEACRYLKTAREFTRLSSVTAIDRWPLEPRFEIVYHIHSISRNGRLRLKCRLASGAQIESVAGVWRAADWYEREVFDLFGVPFRNHPDLRRIMMPDDWEGHPLRKDYPVHGRRYSYKDAD